MKINLLTKRCGAKVMLMLSLWTYTDSASAKDPSVKGADSMKVSMDVTDSPVENVLASIGTKTKMKIHYDRSVVSNRNKVSLSLKDASVNNVLDEITDQTGLQFAVVNDKVIVEAAAARAVIKGTVKDSKGQPLPGVSVLIKGTTKGTSTNAQGAFTISANPNDVLVFSFVGFQRREVAVGSQTTLNIVLQEDAAALKEVVVTSLGIKRQSKALGYAVSTVSAKELTQAGSTNFASAMYGKAAGVKIQSAPGGASSAVSVQIRGVNSLNYDQQPLYVVDGVMIRNDNQNGAAGANNNNYWGDQRIRGNGILDINPNDIESLTVLKGASATALYGSDAGSGVIVITTKKGSKERGLGVDFNYTGLVENVAFLPKYQNIYGPGYDKATNYSATGNAEGWYHDGDKNVNGGLRPYFRAYGQFGPKMEGQQVTWWDGSIRSYSPQPDNYKQVYETGTSSNLNVALSNQTDKVNYRFSATRLDYNGTQPGNKLEKNTFNLNSTVKLSDKVSTDIVVSYINTITKNRPYLLGQVLGSYAGFFSRAEDMSVMKEKYQTSKGYKYVTYDHPERSDEYIRYNIRATNLLDFFWQQKRNQYKETENRLLTSATLNWEIANHLRFRGRAGSDFTGIRSTNQQYNDLPVIFNANGGSTGGFTMTSGNYGIAYGDALVTYNNKLASDLEFSLSGGVQGRREKYQDMSSSTQQGLVTENWFSLTNSYAPLSTTGTRKEMLKYAYLGILNLSYKNYLFLEGTARQEYTSTLAPDYHSYFYPSVNSGFVFSDAFAMPSFLSYGKIRASYGVVGNAPPMYEGNVLYTQNSLQTVNGSVPALTYKSSYGNLLLEPEKKYETEFGLETRFWNNRLGLDLSYYTNHVNNQILGYETAPSVGGTKQIINVGKIGSKGFEAALNATPIAGAFRWDARLNIGFNTSKVYSLATGIPHLTFYSEDEKGVLVTAEPGQKLGNIYAYSIAKDKEGNNLISDDGYYIINTNEYVKAGNIMPKAIGGFSNTFTYKGISLDVLMDYRFGGQMVSLPTKYAIGAGMFENTLQYRDAAHGGVPYTFRGQTYDSGVVLPGVNEKTGLPNTVVLDAADYYLTTFTWGKNAWNDKGAVFDNSFIKVREVALGYNLPSKVYSKIGFQGMRVSLIGRNLFYVWKTLENFDPEAAVGNKWWSQGIDLGSTAASRTFGFSINARF
ncbi:SusC/RagA family TonB-linked outer membrane protein [Arcticibacter sp. MXS-1]|uniref:SusC/RagA family TonB-linked outer membrane protein n=1 Tax=Arcticibacter sp. MXS-1 TaxID=3341726 RepID=UPI0035A888A7